MTNGSMRDKLRLAPALGHCLAALLPMVLTFVQVETATALDVGVSVGAAGVGGGLSAGIGPDGLNAGAGVGSEGSRAAASGSTGPSGIGGALGANVGAVGASAQSNLGSGGLSAAAGVSSGGIGASVSGTAGPSGLGGALGGNAGSAGATANAGIGGGQQGLSGGVGASRGGDGTSVGVSTSSASSAANGSGFSGVGSIGAPDQERAAGTIASIAPAAPRRSSLAGVSLPGTLWPVENGASDGGWFRSIHLLKPLRVRPGTPLTVVQSCRNALVSGASPYGAIQVDVASAGRIARLKDGSLSAPVEVRIVFQRGARMQVRQARITCRMDQVGRIVRIF